MEATLRMHSIRPERALCLFLGNTILVLLIMLQNVFAAVAADAQKQPDQSYVIEGTPDRIEIPQMLKPSSGLRAPTGLTQAELESLLSELLSARGGLNTDTYYVLHLVRHDKGEPASRSDAWYAFTNSWKQPSFRLRLNDPEIADHYKQARLFGTKRLSFLYLHYGVPSGTISASSLQAALANEWKSGLPSATSTSVDVDSARLKLFWDSFEKAHPGIAFAGPIAKPAFTPATHAIDLADSIREIDRITQTFAPQWVAEFRTNGGRISGPRGQKLAALSGPPSDSIYYVEDDFLPITYKIDILKKKPVWQDDLSAIATQFGLQAGFTSINVPLPNGALFSASLEKEINYPTSDIVITGIRGKASDVAVSSKVIGTKTYDNERKYWVDLGFVIPFKSVRELKFNSNDQLVQPKPVEKNHIYATVAFFPLGSVNTKADKLFRLAPSILYGMSLDAAPWNHQFVGVALGLKWVQPFVGLAGTRSPIPAADGTIDHYDWGWRLTYGIQIPTRGVVAAIKRSN